MGPESQYALNILYILLAGISFNSHEKMLGSYSHLTVSHAILNYTASHGSEFRSALRIFKSENHILFTALKMRGHCRANTWWYRNEKLYVTVLKNHLCMILEFWVTNIK